MFLWCDVMWCDLLQAIEVYECLILYTGWFFSCTPPPPPLESVKKPPCRFIFFLFFRRSRLPRESCGFYWYVCKEVCLLDSFLGVPSQWRSPGHRSVLHRGESYISGTFYNSFPKVMANQEVIDYLSQSMLVWACSVRKPEGYRVSQVIHLCFEYFF